MEGPQERHDRRNRRRHGLKFGVYLSPWDRHEPKYKHPAAYDKYYLAELEVLATHYGDLVEFWLDGTGSGGRTYDFPKIIETLRTYQPNTMVLADTALFEYGDIRWAGTESGSIDYETWNVIDRHGYLRWRPVEVDTPLRKLQWFWLPNDEASLKTVDELINSYENSLGRGGQWMLGVAPTTAPSSRRGRKAPARTGRSHPFALRRQPVHSHLPTDDNTANALDGDDTTFWSAPRAQPHRRSKFACPTPSSSTRP